MSYTSEEYEAFEARMEEKFPEFFKDKHYGGFAVGAGWWHIIESLCHNIKHHIDNQKRLADLYAKDPSLEHIKDAKEVPFSVAQIKEKFGGLRFYYDGGDDAIYGMVRMAESWADASCEVCGERGTRGNESGWVSTLCEKHRAERAERVKARK
jgi:hypothetical protein